MASKAKKRAQLHKKRMEEQAANAKQPQDSIEKLKERCARNNRHPQRKRELREAFWQDYRERFGSWQPPEPEGPMRGSCARKSIFEDHLFKK